MMAKCLDHLRSKDGRWNASLALLTAGMVALLLTIDVPDVGHGLTEVSVRLS